MGLSSRREARSRFFPFCTHTENKVSMQLLVCMRTVHFLSQSHKDAWKSIAAGFFSSFKLWMNRRVSCVKLFNLYIKQSVESKTSNQIKQVCECAVPTHTEIMMNVVGRSSSVQHTHTHTYIYMSSAVSRHSDSNSIHVSWQRRGRNTSTFDRREACWDGRWQTLIRESENKL